MAASLIYKKHLRTATADPGPFEMKLREHGEEKGSTSKPSAEWYFVAVSSCFTTLYALFFLSGRTLGDPAENRRILSLVASMAHIAFSTLTVAVGPLQFLSVIRTQWPMVHVWLGRVYSLGVLGGGFFALKASWTADSTPQGHYHFFALTLYWLFTIILGLLSIWRKAVAQHKRWMTRNYILSYSAFTIRWMRPILMTMGYNTKEVLTIGSILSWVPASVMAELWWVLVDTKVATT